MYGFLDGIGMDRCMGIRMDGWAGKWIGWIAYLGALLHYGRLGQ